MIPPNERDFYKQCTREIQDILHRHCHSRDNWAQKVVEALQDSQDQDARYFAYEAKKRVETKKAQYRKLYTAVQALFENGVRQADSPDLNPDSYRIKILEKLMFEDNPIKAERIRRRKAYNAIKAYLYRSYDHNTEVWTTPEYTLEEIAAMTPQELLTLKGVGPAVGNIIFTRLSPLRDMSVDEFILDRGT